MKKLVVAKAVLLNASGDMLLLRRSQSDIRRPLEWDLPGGGVEPGEFAEVGAAREIQEEAGIVASPDDLQLVYSLTEAFEDKNVVWLFYLGHTDQTKTILSLEHDQAKWASLDEALKIINYQRHLRALAHIKQHQLVG